MSAAIKGDSGFYIFTWTIRNFSFSPTLHGYILRSPKFNIRTCCDTEWELLIYPNGSYNISGIGCVLRLLSQLPITITWTISIVTVDGVSYFPVERVKRFSTTASCDIVHLVNKNDILENKNFFLPKDILTLRCKIQRCHIENPIINHCDIRSEFGIQHVSVLWDINNFSSLQLNYTKKLPISLNLEGGVQFEILFYLDGSHLDSSQVQIDVKKVISKCSTPICSFKHGSSIMIRCKTYILTTKNIPTLSAEEMRFFDCLEGRVGLESCPSDVVWQLPEIAKRIDLIANRNLYLFNDVLSLHFNFTVSKGEISSMPADVYTVCPESQCGQLSTIGDDLKRLYQEQRLCDISLETTSKTFKAHKVVLACRSPVFKSMFEHDMVENISGIVNISDVDTETFEQMLVFMYTDQLQNDLDAKSAMQLYCAADLYQINNLKEHCYPIFKSLISAENVFDLLTVANEYHDDKLKSIAKSFICKHPSETMDSGVWEKLMEEKWSESEVNFLDAETENPPILIPNLMVITPCRSPLSAEHSESNTMSKKQKRSLKN